MTAMNHLLLASGLIDVKPGLVFWTLVTFIAVALILRSRAWGPILSLVEEREKQIAASVEAAKKERAEAEKLLADQKASITQARQEAADMMRKSQAEMERFKEQQPIARVGRSLFVYRAEFGWLLRPELAQELGWLDDAMAAYREALRLDPSDATARAYLEQAEGLR